VINGRRFSPGSGTFKTDRAGLERLAWAKRLRPVGTTIQYVRFVDDFPVVPVNDRWESLQIGTELTYVVQTGVKVIERCLLMTTDPGDLVLDPTCGAGTSAYVAEQWGRRWITCDTSRVALALARTRLMAARYSYYLLADSLEGVRKEAELTGKVPPEYKTEGDVRKGFVYKRVPHVTLKSIANNPDIREGMSREEIDAAIQRHAETELLYDKPYEDSKRIRVAGPFTVESLSPHRVLATDDERPAAEQEGQRDTAVQFEQMILDNLRKAGVQNTVKNERLVFTRLEPHAGRWLQASGEYVDSEGKTRRIAVSIGPEHGTVGSQQVKEAAKEAVQGVGFDVLVVCGFAFDPHVSEEGKRYGKLTVLIARMNPDLSMGDELLKKTGAGNLFMVFGEPDITITTEGVEGNLTVEVRGVDVYDPTTGQIRSHSTDDIACWFIDTNYNGESFFVRHAYFTGGDEPYEKLKRALRADIDETAWSTLYSTVSRPFAPPDTGKIAVKVINHYGDEVLKVYDVVGVPA
jgi:adenine-specific DNA-methyltransferase